MAATTMEKENVLEGKTTLVRRVSDLFRAERNNNGSSPLLLNHTSMQKLRHCCQNLNLFPILLYSFGQPKAPLMPVSKINLALLIARITERICRVYSSIRCTVIKGLNLESMKPIGTASSEKSRILSRKSVSEPEMKLQSSQSEQKFEKFQIRKRKKSPLLLKLAVYLAPLFLAFQLFAIFSLLVFGKYSPGFVFLLSALMFLGCISMKVLNHDTIVVKTFKHDKRKKQD